MTDNINGGRTLNFTTGKLVSYDFRSAPFLVYGKIMEFWESLGGLNSGLGHPLADPQILDDGSLCSVFEGGHIHQEGSRNPIVCVVDSLISLLHVMTLPQFLCKRMYRVAEANGVRRCI
jgi:hypothetical protein